jgi:hypothetical protein
LSNLQRVVLGAKNSRRLTMRSLLGPVNPKVSLKASSKDIDCEVSLEFLRRGWVLC